ncbi:hypothetical protein PGB90_006665 [Kerria lacca]
MNFRRIYKTYFCNIFFILFYPPSEKVTVLANHLEVVFQPNEISTDIQPIITQTAGPAIKPITPQEIRIIFRKLKPHKAPDLDQITAKIITECPRKVVVFLTYILNASIRLRYFPHEWKLAKVIVIPKPGKPLEIPSSYRPISLLPTLSKIYEKLLQARLLKLVDSLGIIPTHQFGFRAKHSTVKQIHRVVSTIRNSLEAKQFCSTVYLNVKQAFDRVWTQGLLHKISEYLPISVVQLLQSFLTGRRFQVHYGTAVSEVKPVLAGVPQGSVLGLLLYVLSSIGR